MKCLAMVLVTLTLAACSGGEAPPPAATGAVGKDNALSTQVEALARAREANKVIQDAAEQQRLEIDAVDAGE